MSRLAVTGFQADVLQRLRLERGMTQEDLAIQLGVSTTSISSWEHGRSVPDPANYARLRATFGGDDALLREVDELRGLAQHRARAGLSQRQAAEQTGLTLAVIQLVERGVRLPTDSERAALAAAYGITEDEVARLSENLHAHRKGTAR
ncbi:helix-turn-helix domain-containing protein [Cumulibacter manganitolerans]|uniref:helix-turn-helix domain-containing protein n=1 Tax=Cumulibacter manganitolerans TaxID=1884992 RepID=UPI001885ECD0|nr:helix-turn-helix transcriptional regulator [Cumulibacter manganitolerans]